MPIQYKEVNITPKQAGDILDEHWKRVEAGKFNQRHISHGTIAKYAMEMLNGNWKLSPQSVDFDVDGNLINGQHRLEACRRSGITIRQMMSTGWPVDTIQVIDQGKARSISALLGIDGVKNAVSITASVQAIARIVHRGGTVNLTYAQAIYILNKLNFEDSIAAVSSKATTGKQTQGRIVGPLAYYHSAHPKKASEFAESLFTYETTKGSPVATYLKWMDQRGHMRGQNRSTENHMKGFCACLKAWHEGRQMDMVRLTAESIEWLAALNPNAQKWLKAHTCRVRVTEQHKKAAAIEKANGKH